ncbi:MAG: DUF3616 domain-containing protein [Acidobacteria bacterium]|nr:DUF3616 domain-containing protein [Acidobacteriota bacterium]
MEIPEEGIILNGSPFKDQPSTSIMAAPQDESKPQKPAATLHILQRDGNVIEREVSHEETRIGKGHLNDVILADASVSSSHAKINFANNEYTISDLGSRNGTFLNDSRLTQPRALHHGDLIKMGHCTLTFRIKDFSDTESVPRTRLIDLNTPPPPPLAPPTPSIPAINEASLGAALVSSGLVAQSEVDRLRSTGGMGRRLCRALLEEHLVSEIGLRDLMSRTFNIPPVELKTIDVDPEAAPLLRQEFLRDRLVIPLVGQGVDRLTLALADPTDKTTIDQVERLTKRKAALRLAAPTEIITQIDNHFTPRLIGVTPSGEKIEAILNQPEIEIGKATHNRLVISDQTVSSTHAIILSSHGGFSIVDLGSSNGTFINDTRLGHDAHTLQHGDKIQLGQVLLTFRNPAETTEHKTARLSLEALEEVRRRASVRASPLGVPTDPSAWAAVQAAGLAPGSASGHLGEKSEKKKKKKDKEKDKNSWFNPNALSRILAQVLGASVMLLGTYYLISRDSRSTRDNNPPETVTKLSEPLAFTPFQTAGIPLDPGFPLEASGVAWVKPTNLVLLVSDGQPGKVILMSLDELGRQTGDLSLVDLGVSAIDPEGITYGNSYFYIIGSQSDPNAGQQNALLRFAFDPDTRKIREPAQVITDLRSFLLQNVNELKGLGEKPGKQGGLNIEGICWDPIKERLLLGLRSPLIDNEAVIVPLKLRDPLGPFAINNLMTAEPQTIKLNLDGHGIRDIDFDPVLNSFLILSGATELARRENFGLWEWSGGTEAPRQENELDEKAKPEGITHVSIDGRKFVFIVGDSGKYLRLDYKSSNR